MTCEEAIKNNLCLGCSLAENNPNADKCEYRDKTSLERCQELLKGEQMKL